MGYLTPAAAARHDELVNGSTFIAFVEPLQAVAGAQALLERVRAAYPDATHHCWAYRFGEVLRFSDDGEPAGSAGRPMLEVILKRELDNCAAVVVRYFGGKKLGVGGLVRAYSGAVARALDQAGVREVVDTSRLSISAPFADTDSVLRAVAGHDSEAVPDFDERGLRLTIVVPTSEVPALELQLAEITSGRATVTVLDLKR